MAALLAVSSSLANGAAGTVLPTKPSFPKPDAENCPVLATTASTLDLGSATVLVVRNNDILKRLSLSGFRIGSITINGLDNLTKLSIKNNDRLTQIEIPNLPKLKNITIEDNNRLENLTIRATSSQTSWIGSLIGPFREILFDDHVIVIQNNDCLGNLKLENLSNLRELKIESNNNLETIDFLGLPP